MKVEEIRKLSVDEIEEKLDEAREELMRMRFQRATGELTNHNLPSGVRQKIARMLTILKEKRAELSVEGES
jgi:large subunit ribosomal protein L29